jgi:hypothetical protein
VTTSATGNVAKQPTATQSRATVIGASKKS